jgi:hypothetical protein
MSDAPNGRAPAARLQPAGHTIGTRTMPKGDEMTTIERPIDEALIDLCDDEPTRPIRIVAVGPAQRLAMHWSWVDGSPVAHWRNAAPRPH